MRFWTWSNGRSASPGPARCFLASCRAMRSRRIWCCGQAAPDSESVAAGALLAYIMFWVVFEELHLMNLAVRPEVRRHGIGLALVRHALTAAAAQGARTALLEVRASNTAALAFYRKLGFVQKSLRKGYYVHPREDAVIMMRECLEKGGHTMLSEDTAIWDLV